MSGLQAVWSTLTINSDLVYAKKACKRQSATPDNARMLSCQVQRDPRFYPQVITSSSCLHLHTQCAEVQPCHTETHDWVYTLEHWCCTCWKCLQACQHSDMYVKAKKWALLGGLAHPKSFDSPLSKKIVECTSNSQLSEVRRKPDNCRHF